MKRITSCIVLVPLVGVLGVFAPPSEARDKPAADANRGFSVTAGGQTLVGNGGTIFGEQKPEKKKERRSFKKNRLGKKAHRAHKKKNAATDHKQQKKHKGFCSAGANATKTRLTRLHRPPRGEPPTTTNERAQARCRAPERNQACRISMRNDDSSQSNSVRD